MGRSRVSDGVIAALKPQQVRSDLILRAIRSKTKNDHVFITEVKNGPTWGGEHRRLDAVAIKKSWVHPCITGYEVKVNRRDFERDEKWPGYRDMCHRLFFACPAGMIQQEELPADVGLIWYNPEKQTTYTKRTAAFRDIEIPWEMLYYLVICRTESDRHPFFSNKREFLEAWVKDKKERWELGFYVSNKISKEIDDLKQQIQDLKREANNDMWAVRDIEKVHDMLHRLGLRTGYEWIDELEQVIKTGVNPELVQSIESIDRELQRMKAMIRKLNVQSL